jgi:N6-L-threonylcarbamoyladenine synthase
MTRILAIETSCDETAAAVVKDGLHILSNVVASQVELHARYGGVFPELASRAHVEAIVPVIKQAMREAHLGFDDLDAVAVTYGPGLAGSLLVGVNAAKGLALGRNLPLVGVNHLEAHIYAHWLEVESKDAATSPQAKKVKSLAFPLLAVIVSGGHTELIMVRDHGDYEYLGGTLDDAAGEAFDKVGRLLGLPYPGGPAIEKTAREGNPAAVKFPRAWLGDSYDFSFSGLKTAVLRVVEKYSDPPQGRRLADLAASFCKGSAGSGGVRRYGHTAMRRRLGQPVVAGDSRRTGRGASVPHATHPVHGQRRDGGRLRTSALHRRRAIRLGPGRRALAAAGMTDTNI